MIIDADKRKEDLGEGVVIQVKKTQNSAVYEIFMPTWPGVSKVATIELNGGSASTIKIDDTGGHYGARSAKFHLMTAAIAEYWASDPWASDPWR